MRKTTILAAALLLTTACSGDGGGGTADAGPDTAADTAVDAAQDADAPEPGDTCSASCDGDVGVPEPDICEAQCAGLDCGDDGCGGSCGDCADEHMCGGTGLCEYTGPVWSDVRDLMKPDCQGCHGGFKCTQPQFCFLDNPDVMFQGLKKPAKCPQATMFAECSLARMKDGNMPPQAALASQGAIDALEAWIAGGMPP